MPEGLKQRFIAILFALALLGVGFSGGQYYLHRLYQRQVEVSYRRALSEFGTHFRKIADELGKARLAVSGKQRGLIAANLRRLIYAAQGNMGELPLGEIHLERISHLLNSMYEQTYLYVQGELDTPSVQNLHGQIEYVNHELAQLLWQKDHESPLVSWEKYMSTSVLAPEFMQALSLINDGLEEIRPPLMLGEIQGEDIGREQAVETARIFSERKDLSFQVTNETKGNLPSYTVEAMDGEKRIVLEISQKGGMVLWMTVVSEDAREATLSLEEMVVEGSRFLEQRGFGSLHVTDAQILQNRATLTFVPAREGILRYAEPLRVQVNAADGGIIGFWATSFLVARSRVQPELDTAEEVAWNPEERVQDGVEILDQKLALIQNEQQEEVLTKRLGIQYEGDFYLIYLNMQTGDEEQIVQVGSPQFF
ncbi:MAG: germination protein YpeB [Limnochordia bacterium]|jgi:spore germination protein|nr:germination protein YpeB [Limnochordia bacterium]